VPRRGYARHEHDLSAICIDVGREECDSFIVGQMLNSRDQAIDLARGILVPSLLDHPIDTREFDEPNSAKAVLGVDDA
jgi:hypothetical protein